MSFGTGVDEENCGKKLTSASFQVREGLRGYSEKKESPLVLSGIGKIALEEK